MRTHGAICIRMQILHICKICTRMQIAPCVQTFSRKNTVFCIRRINVFSGDCANDPPPVDHATPILSDDGNTATYTCLKGYELKNAADGRTSTCTESSWSNVADLCKIKGKLCSISLS